MASSISFCRLPCDLCKRDTIHSKWGDAVARCTTHSDLKFTPASTEGHATTIKRAIVDTMMLMRLRNVPEAPTEMELRRANMLDRSMWNNATRKHADVCADDLPDDLFGGKVAEMKDPDKLYCSFCGNEVSKIADTREKRAKIRLVSTPEKDEHTGEVRIVDKIRSVVQDVHACPDCCLQIQKPIVVRRV